MVSDFHAYHPSNFAQWSQKPLLINSIRLVEVELAGYFNSKAAAWEALGNNDETYAPMIFEEWLEQQYLTDREARVERLELI